MRFILTDAYGRRIGSSIASREEVRRVGKAHVLNKGGAVMVWFVDDAGNQFEYSHHDTAAITRAVVRARGSVPNAAIVDE